MKIFLIPEHTGEPEKWGRVAVYHHRLDKDEQGYPEVVIILSPDQAVEIIRTLWRLLPLDERPVP